MKRIVFSFLILVVISTYTMEQTQILEVNTNQEAGKKQAAFINAIDSGDRKRIDQLLSEGFDINKPFGLFGYRGHTPLTQALLGEFGYYRKAPQSNRQEIARYLITKGANPAPLNPYLEYAAEHGDVEKVKLFLSFGAKDVNDKGLKAATEEYKHYATEKYDAKATEKYSQVIKLLEQAKKGPVKLTPIAKPVAKPAAAAQPVADQPKAVLRPVTKPAAASPVNK